MVAKAERVIFLWALAKRLVAYGVVDSHVHMGSTDWTQNYY